MKFCVEIKYDNDIKNAKLQTSKFSPYYSRKNAQIWIEIAHVKNSNSKLGDLKTK